MANEIRIRTDFVGGLVEDNPLTNVATTLTSAGLAAVPVIGTTQHFALILDPDGLYGAPETVYVTAHTAAATTATILRAQEGTTARAHNRDVPWTHGPTVADFTTYRRIFKQTVYMQAADITSTTTTFIDIDATNLPALSLAMNVGDVMELFLTCPLASSSTGLPIGFDWLVGQPVSAATSTRGAGYAATVIELGTSANDVNSITARSSFTATEAGVHTFKPQWRVSAGTGSIRGSSYVYGLPIRHKIENLGPVTP